MPWAKGIQGPIRNKVIDIYPPKAAGRKQIMVRRTAGLTRLLKQEETGQKNDSIKNSKARLTHAKEEKKQHLNESQDVWQHIRID